MKYVLTEKSSLKCQEITLVKRVMQLFLAGSSIGLYVVRSLIKELSKRFLSFPKYYVSELYQDMCSEYVFLSNS